jgi:glycosyltransferase involved in cell wall biosynthesis
MHILHVLGNFGHGGAEMGVVRLIRRYPASGVRHSVCAIGKDVSLAPALPAAAECLSLGIAGRNQLAFWRLYQLIKVKRVQVVHVNNLAPWFDAALAARLAGVACIATFHGVESHLLRHSWLKLRMFRLASRWSHATTAVSSAAAVLLLKLAGGRPEAIKVIPNGIAIEEFVPAVSVDEKIKLRHEFGLPVNGLLFGCVAALRPVKNHAGLVQAFATACQQVKQPAGGHAYLVLVGDGPLDSPLKQQIEDLGCAGQVLFLGQQSEANVKLLLRTFDVFVLNSHTEGLSYALLEALASGLPVVATAVGSNPELVDEGRVGILVPAGDNEALSSALIKVLANPEVLPAMGLASRRKAQSYSLESMVDAYAALYRAACPEMS